MGASISSIGKLFAANKSIFRKIGGSLIILFGLHTTGLLKIKNFTNVVAKKVGAMTGGEMELYIKMLIDKK